MSDIAILWFNEEACREVRLSGGKGASLAAMTAQGLPVPHGFVIPAYVLERSVDSARLRALALAQNHREAQALIQQAQPPAEVATAYESLSGTVAVRSSACAEDSDTASYAGQQETYLNVCGTEAVSRRVIDCWASFFSERAIFYRARKGELGDLGMAVVIQKMLTPIKSGVIFTADPVNRRRDRMIIESVFGLG
ncbi:MAG TPA: PEP/pyruvate-binding domain-containing protein, partial [Ktedonobacteraceae bacterium]